MLAPTSRTQFKLLLLLRWSTHTQNEPPFSKYTSFIFDKSSNRQKLFYGLKSNNKYKSLLIYGNRLSPSATVVRKSFLEKHSLYFRENKDFITVEDYDFWLMLAFNNAKFLFLKSFEGEYLMHLNNSSNKKNLHNKNLLSLLKYHVYKVQRFD